MELFKVYLTYFTSTGKYYGEGDFTKEFSNIGSEQRRSCYMIEVFDYVRGLKKERQLPGLESGTWDGPILVDCEDGWPELILP